MVSKITIGIVLLTVATSVAELDLKPVAATYEVEGVKFPQVEFRNGSRRISYTPPKDWNCSGEGRCAVLRPPNKIQAEANIEPLSLTSLGETKQLAGDAAALLPKGSTQVEILGTVSSPIRIEKRETLEVLLAYSFFGQHFKASVLFVPHDQTGLRFRLSARAVDFDELHRQFLASLFSWDGL